MSARWNLMQSVHLHGITLDPDCRSSDTWTLISADTYSCGIPVSFVKVLRFVIFKVF